jgi:hypothetical protein
MLLNNAGYKRLLKFKCINAKKSENLLKAAACHRRVAQVHDINLPGA